MLFEDASNRCDLKYHAADTYVDYLAPYPGAAKRNGQKYGSEVTYWNGYKIDEDGKAALDGEGKMIFNSTSKGEGGFPIVHLLYGPREDRRNPHRLSGEEAFKAKGLHTVQTLLQNYFGLMGYHVVRTPYALRFVHETNWKKYNAPRPKRTYRKSVAHNGSSGGRGYQNKTKSSKK